MTEAKKQLCVAYLEQWGELCGGGQRSLVDLIRLRERMAVRPVVLLGAAGGLQAVFEEEGVSVSCVRLPTLRRRFKQQRVTVVRLQECLKNEHVDLVHANSVRCALYGMRAAAPLGIPVLVHLRVHRPPSPLAMLIDQWLAIKAQAIVANSQSVARRFRGMPMKASLHVVGNGIALPRAAPRMGEQLRRQLGIPPSAPVLAVIGMIEPRKGHHVLLKALTLVRKKFNSCCLLVAGGAAPGYEDHRRRLEEEAARLQITDGVHWLGNTDIGPVMDAMDVLVHPVVRREGFGRVIAESFAAQKPVIASRLAALDELVEDRINGLFAIPGDANDLAAKIEELIASPELRKQMGHNGYAYVANHLTLDGMADALRSIYEGMA